MHWRRKTAALPHSDELNLDSYPAELRKRLRIIFWKSRGDLSKADLEQDLWLYRTEIAAQQGRPFDVNNPQDQKLLLRRFNRAYMKDADNKQRYAKRLDQEVDAEDGTYRWGDRISAPESSDPCVALIQKETATESLKFLRASYSQAAAYAVTFSQFDNQRQLLSAYLAITVSTLMNRVLKAIHLVTQQPSLFDGIEHIPEDFMPREGCVSLQLPRNPAVREQAVFTFVS